LAGNSRRQYCGKLADNAGGAGDFLRADAVAFEREEADDSHTSKLLDREMRKLEVDALLTMFISKMIACKPHIGWSATTQTS
jgi:hypothetical protein